MVAAAVAAAMRWMRVMVQLSVCERPSSALLMSWSISDTPLSSALRSRSSMPSDAVVGVVEAGDEAVLVVLEAAGVDDDVVVEPWPSLPQAARSRAIATAAR